MSVSFLISQAKSVQKVIDENSAEIEVLDQKLEMETIFLTFKEV